MAQAAQPAPVQFGEINKMWFYSAVPSLASDGPFAVGDWIINTSPSNGGTAFWVVTAAGTGATATFRTVTNS
jgi:hypothetical protein